MLINVLQVIRLRRFFTLNFLELFGSSHVFFSKESCNAS